MNLSTTLTFLMMALLAAGVLAAEKPAPASAPAGDWRMPRRDRNLSNRSPLKGDLKTAPRELWRLDTAAWAGEIEVVAGEGTQSLSLMAPVKAPKLNKEWRRMLDVSGSGTPVPIPGGYWAKLLPDVKGLQRVAWTSTWGETPSKLQCFSYANGLDHPKLEWETPPENTVYSPQTCIADVNGDGKPEIVVAMHYRIMIFEAATGKKLHELRYHHLRNYGFFGMFFEPGDPNAKFVNISDFAHHFDVVNFNGSDMVVAFRRDVQGAEGGGITRSTKIIRPGPNPLEDLDADGHAEMTFNLFDDEGDGRWHVMSYQPLTGTVKLNLKGQYLVGIADVDGCGHPELLCQSVAGRHTSGWSTLKVLKLRNGKVRTLAAFPKARFATFDLNTLPPTSDTGAAGGMATAAAGRLGAHGESGVIVLSPGADLRPNRATAYVWKSGRLEAAWNVEAPPGGTLAVRRVEGRNAGDTLPAGQPARVVLSLSSPAPAATAKLDGVEASIHSWNRTARVPPAPLVVTSRGQRYLVTENSSDRVAVYALPTDVGVPKHLWERAGRGMTDGSGVFSGLAAGDLDGDGQAELVFAEQAPETGAAALVAVRMDGRELWRHEFSGYDSDRPIWNFGGLTLWTLAHLTDPKRLDVYVNTRQSTMHSDVSFALDGRTGARLWIGDAVPIRGVPTWGFGGTLVACADFLGNGREQIVSEYPVCYYMVDGRNGRFLHTVDLAERTVLPGWAAYGRPLVADFLGNGRAQVLVTSPYVYGLLTPEGKALWSAPTGDDSTASVAGCAVGDFDGDGKLEVARLFVAHSAAERTRIEFLEGATGKPKGTPFVHSELELRGDVVADLDGDGCDELLLRTGPNTLGAVCARNGEPQLLWQVSLPAAPVQTLVADMKGDGEAALVISCADGTILGMGK